MPRFSVAFTKRKSASDGLDNVPLPSADAPSSFRVIDRTEIENGRSFDGGARMAKAFKPLPPKTKLLDLGAEDNMFADLKVNRGSNISNTTKGTSTDNSSRHSNASTAPSSADMSGPYGHDDNRVPPPKPAPQEQPGRASSKSIGSGFLDRATRTFSFGGQKKQNIPPPTVPDAVPDLPPTISIAGEKPGQGTSRVVTASSVSTTTPANHEESALDLGGDFASMLKGFEKRASTATLTLAAHDNAAPRSLTGNRYGTPGPTSPVTITPTEPLLSQPHSPTYSDPLSTSPTSPHSDDPPPVPRHEHLDSFKYSSRSSDVLEDEDAKLLRESMSAMRFLSEPHDAPAHASHYRYGDEHSLPTRTISSDFQEEDNMFEGSRSKMGQTFQDNAPRSSNPPRNKIMTPAQFERYRQDKETSGNTIQVAHSNVKPIMQNDDDEEEDEINYDDVEDEQEKSKQQTTQRRKQEAHMAVYRQQMMKVTGERKSPPLPARQPVRPSLPQSSTAPVLGHLKAPSPDPATTILSSEEDDEDVPLAILQAHGFPHKNRPPTRLSPSGSNPNLRGSVVGSSSARPASFVGGDGAATNSHRQQNLPAFARNLPQDPFVGASIARPAIRESLHFGDAKRQPSPQPPQGLLPPGGLVGVIASEERSRAMRRGSPSVDPNKLIGLAINPNGHLGQDPLATILPQMMYNAGGMPGMPFLHQMPPPMLNPGDQAQLQMNQQMQHFMQMQMQFMQMMATNQNGAQTPQQPAMHPLYGAMPPGSQYMGDLKRHSMMMDPNMEPPRQMDHHMRTMSMVQPSSSPFKAPFGQVVPSIRGASGAYSPSIAPSERSNVGLPGRYRPVSQAAAGPVPSLGQHVRSNTISGDLSSWSDDKSKSTVKIISNSRQGSDDDEEQGWEAMKAKRENKRSLWRSKRTAANELNITF